MGEAKRRKERDPFYGKVPKQGKGIVISNPMEINASGGLHVKTTELEPIELRRAVLFWDRIEWPQSRLINISGSGAEVDYLTACGMMSRPMSTISGGDMTAFAKGHIQRFVDNERMEPGLWALSEGPSSFVFDQPNFNAGRAPLVELYRAIPLPDADVPLEAVLEFKQKRLDEVRHLSLEIDGFYSNLLKSEDQAFELQRLTSELEKRCVDIIRVAKESGLKFRLSDYGINFSGDVDVTKVLGGVIAGAALGTPVGLAQLGAIVGGACGLSIKIGGGFTLGRGNQDKLATSPFRFVASVHNEMI